MIGLVVLLGLLVMATGYVIGFLLFFVALGAGWTLLSNGTIAGAEIIDDMMLALPIVGPLYARFINPATYFSEDSRLVFEEAVHTIVLQQVESFLKTKGARALAPEETRPQSRPLFS
jgi:type II secretory pathway component PulF